MKRPMLFGLLALSACVFADSETAATDNMMKMPQDQKDQMKDQMSGAQKKEQKMMQDRVILMSARPESDNGWYLFADATYWHADIGSTDWAIKRPNFTLIPEDIEVHSLNFKWNWGFKVGIGANIDHDMWDTDFYYTWFRTENSNSVGRPEVPVLSNDANVDNLLFGEGFLVARIHWNIHYSMFDWELGRWSYLSKSLALRPHVGIKGGWINQKVKVHHMVNDGGFIDNFVLDNDFWGVGPSAGINTMWILGNAGANMQHRFSLCGGFAGALMYGHFHVKEKASFFSNGVLALGSFRAHGLSRNLATAMLQGALGLSWDLAFNRDRNHFTLSVDYELQYWFRQNQLMKFFNDYISGGGARFSDDLALQGITADFRFDF